MGAGSIRLAAHGSCTPDHIGLGPVRLPNRDAWAYSGADWTRLAGSIYRLARERVPRSTPRRREKRGRSAERLCGPIGGAASGEVGVCWPVSAFYSAARWPLPA